MAKITDLVETFNSLKPGIETDFIQSTTRTINRLIETYGRDLNKLYNTWSSDANSYRALRMMIDGAHQGNPVLNTERQAKYAKQYADDQIAAFTHKLVRKLGNLENVTIHDLSFNSFTFQIWGWIGEKSVRVEQSRIINVSPKGNLFHQWPALIYVDGKKTSEKAFKELGA